MLCAVTGANGFVGSHLVERLLEQGHRVRVLVRPTADLRWIEGARVERVAGSVAEREALCRAFADCDWVFHLAGVTSASRKEAFYRVNAEGTRLVAEACLEAAPRLRRLVLVSTIAAVGPGRQGRPLDESAPPRPVNHYGRSKLAGELEARGFGDRLPLAIVRPGAIYGPRDQDHVPLFKLAARGLRLKLGLARRAGNFCHVADVVSGILLAADRDEALGELFNIGDVANYEVGELQRIVARVVGTEARIPLWLPVSLAYGAAAGGGAISRLRGGRPTLNLDRVRLFTARNWTMDVGKAQRMLGYAPTFDLASGLADTVRWCQKMGWLD